MIISFFLIEFNKLENKFMIDNLCSIIDILIYIYGNLYSDLIIEYYLLF